MKKIHAIAMAAAAAMLFSAASADEVLTAKLQTPLAKPYEFVSDNADFNCTGDTCTAATAEGVAWSLVGCRSLARAVGPVTSYGSSSKQLSAEQLATCNKSAKKTAS